MTYVHGMSADKVDACMLRLCSKHRCNGEIRLELLKSGIEQNPGMSQPKPAAAAPLAQPTPAAPAGAQPLVTLLPQTVRSQSDAPTMEAKGPTRDVSEPRNAQSEAAEIQSLLAQFAGPHPTAEATEHAYDYVVNSRGRSLDKRMAMRFHRRVFKLPALATTPDHCATCKLLAAIEDKRKKSRSGGPAQPRNQRQQQAVLTATNQAISVAKGQLDGVKDASLDAQVRADERQEIKRIEGDLQALKNCVVQSGMTGRDTTLGIPDLEENFKSEITTEAERARDAVVRRIGRDGLLARFAQVMCTVCMFLDSCVDVIHYISKKPIATVLGNDGKPIDLRGADLLPANLRDVDPKLYDVEIRIGESVKHIVVCAPLFSYLASQVGNRVTTDDFLVQLASKCRNINVQNCYIDGDVRTPEVINAVSGTVLYFRMWQRQNRVNFLHWGQCVGGDAATSESLGSVIESASLALSGPVASSSIFVAVSGTMVTLTFVCLFSAALAVMWPATLFQWLIVATLILLFAGSISDLVELLLRLTGDFSGSSGASFVAGSADMCLFFLRMLIWDLRTGCLTHIILCLVAMSCGAFSLSTLLCGLGIIGVRVLLRLKRMVSGSMLASLIRVQMPSSATPVPSSQLLRNICSTLAVILVVISLSIYLCLIVRASLPSDSDPRGSFIAQAISQLLSHSSAGIYSLLASFSSISTSVGASLASGQTSQAISNALWVGNKTAALSAWLQELAGVECPEICAHLLVTGSQTLCSGCSWQTRWGWWLTGLWRATMDYLFVGALLAAIVGVVWYLPRRHSNNLASAPSSNSREMLGKQASASSSSTTQGTR